MSLRTNNEIGDDIWYDEEQLIEQNEYERINKYGYCLHSMLCCVPYLEKVITIYDIDHNILILYLLILPLIYTIFGFIWRTNQYEEIIFISSFIIAVLLSISLILTFLNYTMKNVYTDMISFIYNNVIVSFVFCFSGILYMIYTIWGLYVMVQANELNSLYIFYVFTSITAIMTYIYVIINIFTSSSFSEN